MSAQSAHRTAVDELRDDINHVIHLLHLSHEAIICTDEGSRIVVFNQGAERTFGYSASEIKGEPLEILIPERLRPAHREHVRRFLDGPSASRSMDGRDPIVALRKDGTEFPAEASIAKFSYGGERTLTVVLRDVSTHADIEERLTHLAEHDALTDLPNRLLFMDRLEVGMARARRHRGKLALLYLDVDEFKPINDTFGHLAGDEFLKALAVRLRECIRGNDTLARIGGDEFTIILEDVSSEADTAEVMQKVDDILRKPILIDNAAINPSVSIGLALYPDNGEDGNTLLKFADTAMYEMKRRHKLTTREQIKSRA